MNFSWEIPQSFYVDLLKEFQSCTEPVQQQLLVRSVPEDEEATDQFFPTGGAEAHKINLSHLSPAQQTDMALLLDAQLFHEKLGCTSYPAQHLTQGRGTSPTEELSDSEVVVADAQGGAAEDVGDGNY